MSRNDITHDQNDPADTIGRLKSFGVDEPWQSALLLPRRWDDFSVLTDSLYEIDPDSRGALVARIASQPSFEFQKGPPRAQFMIEDGRGITASVTLFGDTKQARNLTVGKRYLMKGKTDTYNGRLQFRLDEIVPTAWAGRPRPVYPGKSGVIGPDLVRTRQLALLPKHMSDAASQVIARLSPLGDEKQLLALAKANTQFNSIESLLWAAHLPDMVHIGESAHEALERLAAADMLLRAREEAGTQTARDPLLLSTASLEARTAALPYPLTDEQKKAVAEITEDLRRPVSMRRLLSGDVGTGKTAVYGTAVATAVDAGARCVVMLPNINLATQVYREIAEYWPDLDIKLVSGDTKKHENLRDTQVLVGTTALLNREIGERDLVVADEQHKFSKAQREKMAADGGHLLEVSATSIPRSQALLQFGVMDLSMLTKGHVEKTIHTRLRYQEDRAELFQDAIHSIEAGHQLAVVYPLKETQSSGDDATPVSEAEERKSAIAMYEAWEKRFPGRVRLLHGQMSDQEKQDVIADMKADKADILISTTVIEVGLTLPRLRRLMVISADRHGLTGLHQLRGRLARHGGEGFFDLYIPQPKDQVNPATIERLSILEQTTDGFAVAEHDMVQRGYGELTGEKQSGKGDGLLLGRTLEVARLTEMTAALPDLQNTKPDPVPMQNEVPGVSQPNEHTGDLDAKPSDQSVDVASTVASGHNADQVETAQNARGDLMLTTGERVKLPSGAMSSAVPKLDFTNERRSHASKMRMHSWLLENAITEATARGDTTNLAVFEQSLDARNLSAADIDRLNVYLFDRLAATQIQIPAEVHSQASTVKPSPAPANGLRESSGAEPVKWFGSNEKAAAWVARQSDPDQFEIVPSGKRRFEIFRRDADQDAVHAAQTPVAAQAEAPAPQPVADAHCPAEEAVHQPSEGDADAFLDQMMAVDAPRKPLTTEEYKANLMREQGAACVTNSSLRDDEVDPLAPTEQEPIQPGLW